MTEPRTCVLTDANMATEDDCTTHDHEPPDPIEAGTVVELIGDRHRPARQRATIRKVYPQYRGAPRHWLYEVRPESYDQPGHPCLHDPVATVRVTHDELRVP